MRACASSRRPRGLFAHRTAERVKQARRIAQAIEALRIAVVATPVATPSITDEIARWLPPRAVRALLSHGITTLTELTLRIPRRRQSWKAIPRLGQDSARQIEAFFADHPAHSFLRVAWQVIGAERSFDLSKKLTVSTSQLNH
jgi:hypothetical protein